MKSHVLSFHRSTDTLASLNVRTIADDVDDVDADEDDDVDADDGSSITANDSIVPFKRRLHMISSLSLTTRYRSMYRWRQSTRFASPVSRTDAQCVTAVGSCTSLQIALARGAADMLGGGAVLCCVLC